MIMTSLSNSLNKYKNIPNSINKHYVKPTVSFLKRSQFTPVNKKNMTFQSEQNKVHNFSDYNPEEHNNEILEKKRNKIPKGVNSKSQSVLIQNIQNGNYTTNIQNNLNINISTSNEIPNSTLKKHNQLFQHKRTNSSTAKLNETSYLDSMKNIMDNKSLLKMKEEILTSKLKNEKLQNEINLLEEKMKTYKSQINGHEAKTEMLKKQYQNIIDFYKKENENLKKIRKQTADKEDNNNNNNNNNDSNKLSLQSGLYLTSTLNILLELIELFLAQKTSAAIRDSVLKTNTENISYSIDIYDSYNNEDDRRTTLIEQIQSIVLSKLKFLTIALNINLEKEISKVKNWSNLIIKDNNNNNSNLSLSNFSQMRLSKKEYTSNVKEKDAISNTSYSDLNSSNIFQGSPKFYRNISFDSLKDDSDNFSKIKLFEMKKDENFSVRMNTNTSAQNDSLDFIGEAQLNNSISLQEPTQGNILTDNKKLFQNNTLGSFKNMCDSRSSSHYNSLKENLIVWKKETEVKVIEQNSSSSENNISNANNNSNSLNMEKEFVFSGPEVKFTSTFRRQTIDLNDEPTDFNLKEICVNNEVISNTEQENPPVILIPIHVNNEINTNNISFTDY